MIRGLPQELCPLVLPCEHGSRDNTYLLFLYSICKHSNNCDFGQIFETQGAIWRMIEM